MSPLVYNISMNTVGIIAEYNPLHNGHKYHLKAAKELSCAKYAVVVMSGDFVQRGEPAMFDKHIRAKWALQNGADMVIALPAAFSLASAQAFASAGVNLLRGTGIVDSIAFGSECGDIFPLKKAAEMLDNEPYELRELIRGNLAEGLSFPDSRARAVNQLMGVSLLSSPNDILGIEYIRALNAAGSDMIPLPIPRTGPGHDSPELTSEFASASAIRKHMLAGDDVSAFLPDTVREDTSINPRRTQDQLSRETVYALRRMSKEQLSALPDVSEGLENLLYSACRECAHIQDVLEKVKSRRYTMARLKRICMCALLGIYGNPMEKLAGLYIRVLGIRKDAMHLLSLLNQSASLPVIARFSDTDRLNDAQRVLHDIDMLAADIASLGTPSPSPAPFDYSRPLLIV